MRIEARRLLRPWSPSRGLVRNPKKYKEIQNFKEKVVLGEAFADASNLVWTNELNCFALNDTTHIIKFKIKVIIEM